MLAPELKPRVIIEGLDDPAGIAFDGDGILWFAEAGTGSLVRAEGALSRVHVGGVPSGIAIDAYGRVWFADRGENAIRRHDPHDGKTITIADQLNGRPFKSPTDLAFDHSGNLLFTCAGDRPDAPDGYACCLSPDGSVEVFADQLYGPTGLAVIHHGDTLLIGESGRKRVWRGDWKTDERIWLVDKAWAPHVLSAEGPCGMAMGADGMLYVAVSGGGRLKALNHDGMIAEILAIPGLRPRCCAFDPNGVLGLVISEAERGQLLSIAHIGLGLPLFNAGHAWPA